MLRFARIVSHLVALIALISPTAYAHELGAITVQGEFERVGTYRFDISADATHAIPAEAKPNPTAPVRGIEAAKGPAQAAWLRALAGAVVVSFDGRPAPSEIAVTLPAADPTDPFATAPRPVLRLTGKIPPGAKHASFRVDLPIGSFPVSFRNPGETQAVYRWQDPGAESEPFALATLEDPNVAVTRGQVIRRYLVLGFTHILPMGLDHILFVLGLFLLSLKLRSLLAQITAFTVAHTLSLALAMLGLVHLSPRIVEPLIAVSIVYVAIENVFARELNKSRVALVFAFGLLHGLGFAGVLSELGLPRSEFVPALLSFNLGVECGQLTVIALAFLAVGAFRTRPWYKMRIAVPASLAIAAVGLYWAVTRALGIG